MSWFGKSRSYEPKPSVGWASIASVSRCAPRRLANAAGSASSKNIQTWAPWPERDRSMAAWSERVRHARAKARASSRQSALSKSTARKWHVSSSSRGYTPATNGSPASSRPDRCQRTTSSVTGRKRRTVQSAHLTRGFSQMPRTHSCVHAGAYPDRPVVRLSKRRGYTSSRPWKSDRNSAIFSSGDANRLIGRDTGYLMSSL